MSLSLGIDFGTTTTLIAVREEGTLPSVLRIGEKDRAYMPSAIAFLPGSVDGSGILVGEAALRARGATVIKSIKRCLHCDGSRCAANADTADRRRREAWTAEHHALCSNGKIEVGGRQWRPEELVFLIIEEALNRALRELRLERANDIMVHWAGLPANVGCSAAFNLRQRRLLAEIAKRLGLRQVGVRHVIEEPILAGVGFAYLEGLKPGRTLVYDFGGGTFDAAVVDVDEQVSRVAVLASAGVANLGGDDIDQMLVEFFLDQISQANGLPIAELLDLLDPALDERELRLQAEAAKIELSSADALDVTLNLSTGIQHLRMTRPQLEEMLANDKRFGKEAVFERSMECVNGTLRLAQAYDIMRERHGHVSPSEIAALPPDSLVQGIDAVLLVGGIPKIPYIRTRLGEVFGERRLFEGVLLNDPIEAVAQGATLDKEYENLLLAAPPYSIVLKPLPCDGWENAETLYEAYQSMWLDPGALSHTQIRCIGQPVQVFGRACIGIRRPDGPSVSVIFEDFVPGWLRVDIDLAARIHILCGSSIRELRNRRTVIAPWQHRLQVIKEEPSSYRGVIDDQLSIFHEN